MKQRLVTGLVAAGSMVGLLPGVATADPGGDARADSCAGQYLAFYAQLNPGIPLGQLIEGPAKGAAVVNDIRATVCDVP